MAGARDREVSKRSFLAKTRQPKGNGRPRKPNSRRLEKMEPVNKQGDMI